jgi:hypothetical protein
VLRPGPAFVITAEVADIPVSATEVRMDPEPDEAWLALYRYRGQDLPPITRTLLTRHAPHVLGIPEPFSLRL